MKLEIGNRPDISDQVMKRYVKRSKKIRAMKADDITIEEHKQYAEMLDRLQNNIVDNVLAVDEKEWKNALNDIKRLREHLKQIYEIEHHLEIDNPYTSGMRTTHKQTHSKNYQHR